MTLWRVTTSHEIEKPWTDSADYGCQYYRPIFVVEAETRGKAKAKAFTIIHHDWEYYDEVEFVNIRVKKCTYDVDPRDILEPRSY